MLVTFLDSDCRAQCPVIAGQLGSALKRMSSSDRRRVTAIAVSVNPRIDTRASVVRFLRQHHALGQVRYLSGDLPDLRRAWKAFQIVSAYETGNADIHSADVRVFDPAGVWVATLHAGVDLTPENLAHDTLTALASGN